MKTPILTLAAVATAALLVGCSPKEEPIADAPVADAGPKVTESAPAKLANADITAISEVDPDGTPKAIGFKFKTEALDAMPKDLNMEADWFDINGNGKLDMDMMATPPLMETLGDYLVRFDVPGDIKDMPFKFLEMNWNAMGHPPKPWEVPHFDFHFYMSSREEVDGIKLGPVGVLIGEEELKKAIMPVDPAHVGKGYVNMGAEASVGKMGNHLIDPTSPELAPENASPFTHTFIFGCYEGKVTFWEPMITRDYLKSGETLERDINLPEKYAVAGWYPTKYCVRHADGYTTVTLEGFVKRDAS